MHPVSCLLLVLPLMAADAAGTPTGAAERPFGLSLMRPDSLAGWDYGPTPPAGWKMAESSLRGSKGAAPLLSGFSFGDFEIRFQWSVGPGATLRVLLPDVPRGDGLRLSLCEGEGCARIEDAGKTVSPGVGIAPAAVGAAHTAAIRRAGAKLAVLVDGRAAADAVVQADRRFGLGLALEGGEAMVRDLRADEPSGEPIFNGRDLDGWWCPDNIKAWRPESGELALKPGGGNYLRTRKDYGNFTLSLEYLIVQRGNSGIGIRTPQAGWPSGDGMEMQIEDVPGLDKHKTMAVYGNLPPLARADLSGQWNRAVVKADGRMIAAWVNGQLVQQANTAFHPELKHRHLKGWIGFQDHGGWIRLRNIRVLEAPDGPGLDAWHRHPAPLATALLLDRLMNSERLSVADGIRAGTVSAGVSGKTAVKEKILAELTGPGALVRVARTSDQGRLAFYFDGETKPRLECKPGDLWRAAPMLSEDRQPVLTCLTYAKGLKVALRDAKAADYAIDYVALPPRLTVESFRTPESGFPRGWLAAVDYRLGQAHWGVIRQNDAMPRYASSLKKIAPGKTETLVHVDGAGVVEWLQLQAPKQALDSDDLVLEVTIDGEAAPAVSAPARYFFPGLAGQGNYPNFAMLERGGPINRLAMPFADGITVAARCAGKKALGGVGVTLCVNPATEANRGEIARRMRLRGRFVPPGPDGELAAIRMDGPGRWVGLVCGVRDDAPTAMESLAVDGREAEGWKALGLAAFLGQTGPFRAATSGRNGTIAWRYLLLEAVDFQQSLVLKTAGGEVGPTLLLYYAQPATGATR